MAHSLVFHSQRPSGQFTAENCPELWSCVGWTNQHLALRWWTNTEAVTHPAEQLSTVCAQSLTLCRRRRRLLHYTATIIRAVINSCQLHRNTKAPPAPTHAANNPCVFWANNPRHTQVIDFYSSCNLLDGQKKVSQSLHTVMHSVCMQSHPHTHTCIYTNRLKLCV